MRAEIPHPRTYRRQLVQTSRGRHTPCRICGRPVLGIHKTQYHMYVDHTESVMVTPDEAEGNENVSMYPVGAECYRKHPEVHPFCVVTTREA